MTKRAAPLPKLRVTCLSCTEALLQYAQCCSTAVNSDDEEFAGEADFDDCVGRRLIVARAMIRQCTKSSGQQPMPQSRAYVVVPGQLLYHDNGTTAALPIQ